MLFYRTLTCDILFAERFCDPCKSGVIHSGVEPPQSIMGGSDFVSHPMAEHEDEMASYDHEYGSSALDSCVRRRSNLG